VTIKNPGRRATVLAAVVPVLALSMAAVPPAMADTPSRAALPGPNAPSLLAVTATVAQADAAFDTQVSAYDSADGRDSPGIVGGFSVPAALGGDILSVTGIDQIALPASSSGSGSGGKSARKSAAKASTTGTTAPFQCSQYWGQYTASIPEAYGHTSAPTALRGYTPDQIRQAYGIASSP
jgi:subtilase family serine protease